MSLTGIKISKEIKARILITICFILLSLIFILPVWAYPKILVSADDSLFHIPRLISLQNALTHGHLLPGYDFNTFGNVGSAINIFYPYVTTALPLVLIHLVVHNWIPAFLIFLFLTTLATLEIAYHWCKKLLQNDVGAFIFSVIYTYATYRIASAYMRLDLGEYMAAMILPIIFVSLELLLQKHDGHQWYWLTIGMSFLIYTHLLSALLVVGLILIRLLISLPMINKKVMMALIKAAGVTLLISAYQVISLLEQYHYQPLHSVSTAALERILKTPAQMLKFSVNNNVFVYTIGTVGVIALVIILSQLTKLQINGFDLGPMAFLGFLTFYLTTDLFPWKQLNHTPFAIIQYPYRFNFFATFFILFVAAAILAKSNQKSSALLMISALTITMLLFVRSTNEIIHKSWRQNVPFVSLEHKVAISDFKNFTTTDYRPVTTEPYDNDINHHIAVIGQQRKPVLVTSTADHYAVNLTTTKNNQNVDLPIINYRGNQVFSDQKKIPTTISPRGTLQMTLKQAGNHRLLIDYQPTKKRIFASIISVIASIALISNPYFTKYGLKTPSWHGKK
ncbi:6-pyruvoyl-tetrahydropterin synthase-related protein [Agrilactobacillus fermenti]|uniref:6-pyruvoyl-tetrahydropterin synthase-related protein n=1 Tax=Agrilactobacillus fermenti TaxID=2586909 RepID=UPI003A5C7680